MHGCSMRMYVCLCVYVYAYAFLYVRTCVRTCSLYTQTGVRLHPVITRKLQWVFIFFRRMDHAPACSALRPAVRLKSPWTSVERRHGIRPQQNQPEIEMLRHRQIASDGIWVSQCFGRSRKSAYTLIQPK